MTDSYDDMETKGLAESTYCQRHKAGKGLWPHECPECRREEFEKERKKLERKRK